MTEPYVIATHDHSISRLTLNRPKAFNALSEGMLDALQHELDNLPQTSRVVVIAATGKAFCAGHDLKQMREHTDQAYFDELFKRCSHLMTTLLTLLPRLQSQALTSGCFAAHPRLLCLET